MTFELEMALDVLNGQIDRGVEFHRSRLPTVGSANDRTLEIYPVSQDELTEAYDDR